MCLFMCLTRLFVLNGFLSVLVDGMFTICMKGNSPALSCSQLSLHAFFDRYTYTSREVAEIYTCISTTETTFRKALE